MDLLVQPLRRMDLVSLHCPVVRIHACELDVLTEIVSAVIAEEACSAGDTGFDGHAVT